LQDKHLEGINGMIIIYLKKLLETLKKNNDIGKVFVSLNVICERYLS
jgi:hypothetical protein